MSIIVDKMDKLILDFVSTYNTHNVDKIADFYTEDCIIENIGTGMITRGKANVKNNLKEIFGAFPDIKIEMKTTIRSEDMAAGEFVMSGTHSGDYAGIPATGKKFTLRGVKVAEFRNDKIVRDTDYWNMVTLLQLVGKMPSGSGKE